MTTMGQKTSGKVPVDRIGDCQAASRERYQLASRCICGANGRICTKQRGLDNLIAASRT
jgi:hypothetical protein